MRVPHYRPPSTVSDFSMNRRNRPLYHTHFIIILLVFLIYRSGNPIPCAEAADNPYQQPKQRPSLENYEESQRDDTIQLQPLVLSPEESGAEIPRQTGSSEDAKQSEETGETVKKGYGEKADDFQEMISRRLEASASWVDSFFHDERVEIEENKSTLKIRFSTFLEDGEGIEVNSRVRLRLVLPELEDKVHIEISGERDPDIDTTEKYNSLTERRGEIDNEADKNWNLALRYFIEAAEEKNFSFKLGARLNDFTPVIYGGPRYSVSKDFDSWLLRFTQEVKWFTDEGWESRTRFDYERSPRKDLFFRTSAGGSWYQDEEGYFYDINLYLYQILDRDRALEYSWNNFFKTQPNHELYEILLRIEYRRRFWRKWLFFEVRPQVAFREEDDFEPTIGISFGLEALFGKEHWW
jgi:hypothetical protein